MDHFMILTFLFNMASTFFLGLAGLTAGIAQLPQPVADAFGYAVNASNQLNYIIPTYALYGALGLVISVEAAIWLFQGGVWIYRHIPFIGH